MTKSTKSHQRERSPLFENSSPVSATPTNALRALVNPPCLGDAKQRTSCIPCLGDAKQRTACIGSFPLSRRRQPTLRVCVNSPNAKPACHGGKRVLSLFGIYLFRRYFRYLHYPFAAEEAPEAKASFEQVLRNKNAENSHYERYTERAADKSRRYAENIYCQHLKNTACFRIAARAEYSAYRRIRYHSHHEPEAVYHKQT